MSNFISLKEIIDISKGKKHDNVFDYQIDGFSRYIQIDDLRNDTNLKYTNDKGVSVTEKDVIIAWDGANAGTIGFNLAGYIGSTLARLKIKDKNIDTKFLGWFLKSKFKLLRSQTTGATIPHISRDALEKLQIPKVPLPIQQKIASILEKADAARQKRAETLKLTEQFLQSAFLDMFGDPVKNEKGWKVNSLVEITSIKGGGTPSMKNPEYYKGNIPWVTPKDMKALFISTSIDKISEDAIEGSSTKLIDPFSILMVNRSGILKNSLPVAINLLPVTMNQDMKAFKCNKNIDPFYLLYHLIVAAPFILKSVRSTTVDNISSEVLKKIQVMLPPLSLQQKFATLVEKVEKLREKQRQSEAELEQLFQSLMQRAFNGELIKESEEVLK